MCYEEMTACKPRHKEVHEVYWEIIRLTKRMTSKFGKFKKKYQTPNFENMTILCRVKFAGVDTWIFAFLWLSTLDNKRGLLSKPCYGF